MTLPRTITAAASAPQGELFVWRAEAVETVKLAWPMALTQLGQIAMMTTDLALIGRLGDAAVASVGLAHLILFLGFVFGMGLVSAVATLAAQAYGAREPRMVRRSLRMGLWAAVILGVPINIIQMWGEDILLAAGQTPESATLAARYLDGLAWSMIPAWCFIALRNFMSAVNRPEPALWITLVAIPVNGLLAYALIHGHYGLPRLDLLGAGLATTFVNLGMCAAAVWVCYALRPFKKYRVLGRFWRMDWELMRQLIVIGVPISGTMLLEWGLFSSAAILIGWIGTTALAAHQIALQIAAILFMIPFGISMAATVRVGHAVGRGDPIGTRRAGFTALALGAVIMIALTLVVVVFRDVIPVLFLGDTVTAAAETTRLAGALLLVGATWFVFDGIQGIAAGALRGLNDTRVPMLYAALSFWIVGFTSAYALAFWFGFGVYGVWIGFALSLWLFAALLTVRFRNLTARGYLPAVP
ncbi:MAG: MATE family efflux transporter [Xanthobacteraceae bacterium]|nr:MATE family efflux transporter [Xanthobacteraceae bacterium]